MQFKGMWVVLGVMPVALGCYTYTPLDTSTGVQAGEHVSVEITDRGRAELGDRLGSGVLRLEGMLTRADTANLEMNVWRVAHFSGPVSRWSGETVLLRREYASRVQSRTLDRGKTYLVAGAALAGFVLFTSQFDLLGFASDNGGTDSLPPPISSRGWWP